MSVKKIAIYIPNYNGAEFLKKVNIPDECDCVVMDNCSTDDSVHVCIERGFLCVENDIFVSRTENWIRCISHFRDQQYKWMKWLFTDDELCEDSYNIMADAVCVASDASIILFDYYINDGMKKVLKSWKDHFDSGIVDAKRARISYVEKGPFCSPVCWMMSKNCNFDDVDISEYSWAADVKMLNELIGEHNIYYCNKPIGVFNSQFRKTYVENKRKLSSYLESLDVVYAIYKECQIQSSGIEVDGAWFYGQMVSCLTDNINSFRNFCDVFKALIKGVGKLLLKKNGGNVKL